MKINLWSNTIFLFFLIQSSYSNFLSFNPKKNCPNTPVSSLGILINLSETDNESKSSLNEEERVHYEEMINLKRSFTSSTSFLPQSFSPENEEYWSQLKTLLIVFIVIAVFPTLFIIFYLIMRFIFKKCAGPKKISDVSKTYRNITWGLMIISTAITLILFSIILYKSIKVGNMIGNTFNYSMDIISKSEIGYDRIHNVVEIYKKHNLNIPLPDEVFMSKLKNDFNNYIQNTKSRSLEILDKDKMRTIITIIVYVVYILLIILSIICFIFKFMILEGIISIILFFAIPSFIILEGYNSQFFFYYGDLCDSVNGALYSNEFPVADKSLGYYYNCFPAETKASLYNIRYRLFKNLENDNKILEEEYNKLNEDVFDRFLNCDIVSYIIPYIEKEFCKDSLDDIYSLITLYVWMILSSVGVAIAVRRIQVLIWKKKNEIESMIVNQEILY